MYDISTILKNIKEYNQLRSVNKRYSASLFRYRFHTIGQFIYEYNTNGLRGKPVYDKLMIAVAPAEFLPSIPS